jgi:hypothetical protein
MEELSAQYGTSDDGKGGSVSSSALKAAEMQMSPKQAKRDASVMSSGGDGSPHTAKKRNKAKAGTDWSKSVMTSFGGEGSSEDPMIEGLLQLGKMKEEKEDLFRKSQMQILQAIAESRSIGGESSGGGGGGSSSSQPLRSWWSGKSPDEVSTWASVHTPRCEAVIAWLCNEQVCGDDIAALEIAELTGEGIKLFEGNRFLRAVAKAGH